MLKKLSLIILICLAGLVTVLVATGKQGFKVTKDLRSGSEPVRPVSSLPPETTGLEVQDFAVVSTGSTSDHVILAVDSLQAEVRVVSLETGELLNRLFGFKKPRLVEVSEEYQTVLVLDEGQRTILQYSLSDVLNGGKPEAVSIIPYDSKEQIMSMDLDQTGEAPLLYLGVMRGTESSVRVTTFGGVEERSFLVLGARPGAITVDPEADRVYVSDGTRPVVKSYTRNGTFLGNLTEQLDRVRIDAVAIYSCGEDGYAVGIGGSEMKYFDRRTGKRLGELRLVSDTPIKSFRFVQEESQGYPEGVILALTEDSRILIYDGGTAREVLHATTCFERDDGETKRGSARVMAPVGLRVARTAPGRAEITWSPAAGGETVNGYIVYRNGERLATTKKSELVDSSVSDSRANLYTVSAVGLSGVVSDFSRAASLLPVFQVFRRGPALIKAEALSVSVTSIAARSAMVRWKTHISGTSEVRYGTDESVSESYRAPQADTTSHEVLLGELTPGTTYYFQVFSRDASSQVYKSGIGSFKTDEAELSEKADKTAPRVVFSPLPGVYQSKVSVALSLSEKAKLKITTDGSDPLSSTSSAGYNAPILVSRDTVVRFVATDEAGNSVYGAEAYTFPKAPETAKAENPGRTFSADLLQTSQLQDPVMIYDDSYAGAEYDAAIYEGQIQEENLLFVSHTDGAKVEVWNLSLGQVVTVITNLVEPYQLAVDSFEGALYIADRGDSAIKKYLISDLRNGNLTPSVIGRKFGEEGAEPYGIAVLRDGAVSKLYAIFRNSGGTKVKVFDTDGNQVSEWAEARQDTEFMIADSVNRQILISDRSRNSIFAYSPDGRLIKEFGGGKFSGDPKGLGMFRCETDGYLLAIDQSGDEVEIFRRKTFEHLGKFKPKDMDRSSGIAVLDSAHPRFPYGAVFIPVRERYVEAISWETLKESLGVSLCAR